MRPHDKATLGSRPQRESDFALRFFAAAAVSFALAGGLGTLLVQWLGRPEAPTSRLPPAFFASTLLMAAGSICLQQGP